MDATGKIFIGVAVAAFLAAVVGFYFLSKHGPRGAVLAVALFLFAGGVLIPDSNSRELHLLEGILRLTGFTGGILGIIDLFRKRKPPAPEPAGPSAPINVEEQPMDFQADNTNRPYASPLAGAPEQRMSNLDQRKQSGLGITSTILAVVNGMIAFVLVVGAGVAEASTPRGMSEDSPVAIIVGLGVLAIVALAIVGMVLGTAGLAQANRYRLFAILGLVFNLLVILGLGGILVIGIAAS